MVLRTIRSHAIARLTPSCALGPVGLTLPCGPTTIAISGAALSRLWLVVRAVGLRGVWVAGVMGRKTGGRWSVWGVGPAGARGSGARQQPSGLSGHEVKPTREM